MMTNPEWFVDPYQYAEVAALCDRIRDNSAKLLRVSKALPYHPWPDPSLCGRGWNVAAMRYAYSDYNVLFPWLHTPLVQSAGFSTLAPHTEIKAHSGYAGDIFRLHFGVDCPDGDCALRVGTEVQRWRNGEFLMFSDLDNHEAWNRTDTPRTILLLDISKAGLAALDLAHKRVG